MQGSSECTAKKEIKVSLVLYYIGIRSLRDKRRREKGEKEDEEGRDESSVLQSGSRAAQDLNSNVISPTLAAISEKSEGLEQYSNPGDREKRQERS